MKENVQQCEEKKEVFEEKKEEERKETTKSVGLLDEFMDFLSKQGVFNKNIFQYIQNNKDVL